MSACPATLRDMPETVRLSVEVTEWFPVFTAYPPPTNLAHLIPLIEFTKEEAARIETVQGDFAEIQELIRSRFEGQRGIDR